MTSELDYSVPPKVQVAMGVLNIPCSEAVWRDESQELYETAEALIYRYLKGHTIEEKEAE